MKCDWSSMHDMYSSSVHVILFLAPFLSHDSSCSSLLGAPYNPGPPMGGG